MSLGALDLADQSPTQVDPLADGFRILGPLEVTAGGRLLPLGPPQQRALLAVLVLRAGEVVATDTLVDALWGDRPPESAANLIQVYVARLRALLEPGRQRGDPPRLLLTRAPGYVLAVPPDQVDARRFERLVIEARPGPPHVAAARLREALALWRGPVLADLPEHDFARSERLRLAGLRRIALDARVDADLAIGRHAELIPELEALVAEDPLRERTWSQLMIALYRAGHQAQALATYETARKILADKLGLDPGPELQRLQEAILRQDVALQAAPRAPVPGNLPAPLTSFIGRTEEFTHVRRLLTTSRLVTLVGFGGCGKTRLAMHTAAAVAAEYRDGAWMVDLAPIADPARVPLALAAALGVRDEPGRPVVDTLGDALRSAQMLIVLDNCEHLVEACAELAAALLRACPAVRILATSREMLAVPGEAAWSVPPLSASEAIALFADRGATVDSFRLSPQTEPFVTQICRRLDGIPLAIELAAARLRALSVREVAERLNDRFRLLSSVTRGTPARHRTLQAMVDWSYALLSEPERALFDRLSVFAGGFTLDAVEAVGGMGGDTVGVLGRLMDKSFVLRGDTGSGAARYRLLATLRQYACQRLAERGEVDLARRRHAAYYLALAEEAAPHFSGSASPDSPIWLDYLDAERANLRAALAWAFGGGDVMVGLRTTLAAWRLWLVRGPLGEGRQLVETALRCSESAAPTVRMGLLYAAGLLAITQCDFERSTTAGEECLALAERHADDWYAIRARHCLSITAWWSGSYEPSHELLEEAAAHARRLGEHRPLAIVLAQLAGWVADHGDDTRAIVLLDESLQLAHAAGEPRAIGFALDSRAMIAAQQHDDERAATLAHEALAAYRAVGFAYGIASVLGTLAVVAERRGEIERAATLHLERSTLCRQLGNHMWAASCLEGLARVAAARDRPVTAAHLFGAADALRAEIGAPVPASERADHDRHLATVRTVLGSSTFRAAWAAGQIMTMEQAFAEAGSVAGSPDGIEEAARTNHAVVKGKAGTGLRNCYPSGSSGPSSSSNGP